MRTEAVTTTQTKRHWRYEFQCFFIFCVFLQNVRSSISKGAKKKTRYYAGFGKIGCARRRLLQPWRRNITLFASIIMAPRKKGHYYRGQNGMLPANGRFGDKNLAPKRRFAQNLHFRPDENGTKNKHLFLPRRKCLKKSTGAVFAKTRLPKINFARVFQCFLFFAKSRYYPRKTPTFANEHYNCRCFSPSFFGTFAVAVRSRPRSGILTETPTRRPMTLILGSARPTRKSSRCHFYRGENDIFSKTLTFTRVKTTLSSKTRFCARRHRYCCGF